MGKNLICGFLFILLYCLYCCYLITFVLQKFSSLHEHNISQIDLEKIEKILDDLLDKSTDLRHNDAIDLINDKSIGLIKIKAKYNGLRNNYCTLRLVYALKKK